jgi:hypothetical protein
MIIKNGLFHACDPGGLVTSVLAPVGSLKPCSPCHPHAWAQPLTVFYVRKAAISVWIYVNKVFPFLPFVLECDSCVDHVGTESMPSRWLPLSDWSEQGDSVPSMQTRVGVCSVQASTCRCLPHYQGRRSIPLPMGLNQSIVKGLKSILLLRVTVNAIPARPLCSNHASPEARRSPS